MKGHQVENHAENETHAMTDVVVVGAGIAGLSAAEKLVAHGLDVKVFEARQRVGGRLEGAQFSSGERIELGGQWVGPTQDEVLAMVKRLGLETFTVYDHGASLLFADGARRESQDNSFGLDADSALAFSDLVGLIDQTAAEIELSSPWESPGADHLDRMTASQWLDQNCQDVPARQFADTMLASIFAAETDEYSALHMLFYLGSGGGLHRMMITIGGAQESRVRGGTHQLAERLAQALADRVVLDAEVLEISGWAGEDGTVNPAGKLAVKTGETLHYCDRVIVALPPVMASKINYDPPLPANRDIVQSHMTAGNVIKFQIEYREPFWRSKGLSGTILSLDHHVSLVYDNCVPYSTHGILVAFVEGRHAREFNELTEAQRAQAVIDDLTLFLGDDASRPIEVLQRNWSEEPFTRGCYGGRFATGLWTTVGDHLAKPTGRIFWAGSETSPVWNGYIDGAIRSGQRAADEVKQSIDC